MARNSHQDALAAGEYKKLLAVADDFEEPYRSECLFILIAGGRLGLRAGEITHFRTEWVNWDKQHIEIPAFQDCDCGYCRHQASQSARKRDRPVEEAMAEMWSPKTATSARVVPFGFDDMVREVIEEFAMFYDEFEHSRSAVNRRVDRLLEAAGFPQDKCYPHALRATAATYHAYEGLPAPALMSLMGWSQLQVARKYIRLSGGATADALRDVHED